MRLIIPFLFLILLLLSCNDNSNNDSSPPREETANALISKLVIYDVNIISHEEDDNDWYENIPKKQRKVWIEKILENVKSGNISAFHGELGMPTNKNEDQLSRNDLEVLLMNPEEITYDHISKITFAETWYFDPNTLGTQKEIKGIALSSRVKNSEGEFIGNQRLFWIWFDDIDLKKLNLPF